MASNILLLSTQLVFSLFTAFVTCTYKNIQALWRSINSHILEPIIIVLVELFTHKPIDCICMIIRKRPLITDTDNHLKGPHQKFNVSEKRKLLSKGGGGVWRSCHTFWHVLEMLKGSNQEPCFPIWFKQEFKYKIMSCFLYRILPITGASPNRGAPP